MEKTAYFIINRKSKDGAVSVDVSISMLDVARKMLYLLT